MSRHWMFLTLCSCLAVFGCDSSDNGAVSYEDAPLSEKHEHGHAHDGVHGGLIIEFDPTHAHHAELVFDEESRDITLYFYGAEIGEGHPAEDLVFELEEGDDELHLDVTGSPLEGEETASRFVVAGADVPDYVKSGDDLHGHFHVTLDGTDYRGSFGEDDHDHGEEGHGHDHDEHDHDEHDHDEHDHDGEEESAEE